MKVWWTKKYQKSPLSPEFQSYTIFELVVEFFEDYYSENKSEMYEIDDAFVSLGDPLIDKWEREVRAGLTPNIMEDLPPEEAEKLINWSKRAYKKKMERGIVPPNSEGIGGLKSSVNGIEELLDGSESFKEEY